MLVALVRGLSFLNCSLPLPMETRAVYFIFIYFLIFLGKRNKSRLTDILVGKMVGQPTRLY